MPVGQVQNCASNLAKSGELLRVNSERTKCGDLNLELERKLLNSEAEVQGLKKLIQDQEKSQLEYNQEKERLNHEIKNLVVQINNQPVVDHNRIAAVENDLTISQALVHKLNAEKNRLEADKTLLGSFSIKVT